MNVAAKFPDCKDCKFFRRRGAEQMQNPVCGECGAGEFFEERVRSAAPSDNELMNQYRKTYHE